MTNLPGTTRNALNAHYALLTPNTLVPSYLPGWEKALCHILISPALGARFSQLLITLEKDGQCAGNTGTNQYFLYLLEGAITVLLDSRKHRLEPGGYAFVPAGHDVQIASAAPAARLLIFQKPYQPLARVAKPAGVVSHEREVKPLPIRGTDDARVQALLPTQPAFNLAVNVLTFPPGAALPAVESPVMERGLLLLRGQGVFRLGTDWHPVQAGDAIWAAPFCPQWFVAMGKTPATYICCQDANRDPM